MDLPMESASIVYVLRRVGLGLLGARSSSSLSSSSDVTMWSRLVLALGLPDRRIRRRISLASDGSLLPVVLFASWRDVGYIVDGGWKKGAS